MRYSAIPWISTVTIALCMLGCGLQSKQDQVDSGETTRKQTRVALQPEQSARETAPSLVGEVPDAVPVYRRARVTEVHGESPRRIHLETKDARHFVMSFYRRELHRKGWVFIDNTSHTIHASKGNQSIKVRVSVKEESPASPQQIDIEFSGNDIS